MEKRILLMTGYDGTWNSFNHFQQHVGWTGILSRSTIMKHLSIEVILLLSTFHIKSSALEFVHCSFDVGDLLSNKYSKSPNHNSAPYPSDKIPSVS